MDKSIFSRRICAGTRIYYVDAKTDRKGQRYISLSEIPTDRAPEGKRRQRVFIHAENVAHVIEALNKAAAVIRGEAKCQ